MRTAAVFVWLALAAAACGPGPAASAKQACTAPMRDTVPADRSVPGRQLQVPPGCCFSPGADNGGEIWCPGSVLAWSVYPQPAAAQKELDEVVVKLRNTQYARMRESTYSCSILGVQSTCYHFAIFQIPGPFQRLQLLAGAVTTNGQGVVAACRFYPGAGRPANCRQLFTP